MWCVYSHTNKINGKTYIGITSKKPTRRWRNGSGYKKSLKFYSAIKKYGWDNFDHSILFENLKEEKAKNIEQQLISYFKDKNMSYNITNGGDGNLGWIPSDETKRKISESHKGKILTEEHKKRISEGEKGRIVSEETKRKISESHKGKKMSEEQRLRSIEVFKQYFSTHEHPMLGKKMSEESKEKNLLSQKTRIEVYCYDLNGNLIKKYNSKREILRNTNFSIRIIKNNCIYNSNKPFSECKIYKGFIFDYNLR